MANNPHSRKRYAALDASTVVGVPIHIRAIGRFGRSNFYDPLSRLRIAVATTAPRTADTRTDFAGQPFNLSKALVQVRHDLALIRVSMWLSSDSSRSSKSSG